MMENKTLKYKPAEKMFNDQTNKQIKLLNIKGSL